MLMLGVVCLWVGNWLGIFYLFGHVVGKHMKFHLAMAVLQDGAIAPPCSKWMKHL